jgi:hypothetical protein
MHVGFKTPRTVLAVLCSKSCSHFQDVGGGTRPWEILWQLPVQRVDFLATDVADDYGRTIWRHATPFAPL